MLNSVKNKTNLQIYIIIGLLIIIIVLIFLISSKITKYNSLSNDYALLKSDYNKEILKTNDLNQSLITETNKYIDMYSKYTTLQAEDYAKAEKIENLNRDKNQLSDDYNKLNTDYTSLITEINKFKTEIINSMDWFKLNSNVDNISQSTRMESHLRTCVTCDDKTCTIKTACINWFVNETKFHLKYGDDNTITKKEDKLQSIDSFLLNEAGDCEEYALLFSAEIRYLVNYVIVERHRTPIIEAIIETNTTVDYQITSDWYYSEGIEGYKLDENYIYPEVACGTLFDIQTNEYNGHCVVMITNKDINSVSDLSSLSKIYLIEPQLGTFIDFAEYNGVLRTKKDNSKIDMLITKKDLYMHESRFYNNTKYNSPNWYGYETFLNEINNLKN